jgi:hypothetical protein
MLELKEIALVLSGVSVRETKAGSARFIRLSDLADIKAGRSPALAMGEMPGVARALTIEDGDLVVGARGAATDICVANDAVFGAFISLDLYLVRPNPALIDPRYLAAFLGLPSTQAIFSGGKQGTGLTRLRKDSLEQMQVPLPPVHAQRLVGGLASAFEEEGRLLKKLTDLRASLGRETIMRAIRTAEMRPITNRSPT